ncbi:MAG: hypothetical protein QOE99_1803 [Actinomycetota bacterium]|jgi:hypothetical protein|nr:hypothetical protein [Actinomycetota bacterium]
MTGMAASDARLSPSEDGLLRRLFFFESTGATLAPPLRVLKSELRQRDQRRSVRAPEVAVTRVPHYV